MKILLINPNISDSVTELIRLEAQRSALPGTEVLAQTAQFGVAYIETRAEAVIGAHAVLQSAACHANDMDAVIVAAYGDPGLCALKELLDVPVIGLTEASIAEAHLYGGRFSLVGISQRIGVWYQEVIRAYGFNDRMASYRGLNASFSEVGRVQDERRDMLLQLCLECVEKDGADSIILSGAPLAGLARDVADRIPVPLIDGVGSAMRAAQSLVALGGIQRHTGSYARPPHKGNRGLSTELQRMFNRQ